MADKDRLRRLLIILIFISALFTSMALYTVSAIFTVARFNIAELKSNNLILKSAKNLIQNILTPFSDALRRFGESGLIRSGGALDYNNMLDRLIEEFLAADIEGFIWLDREGIPLFTGAKIIEPPYLSQMPDERFQDIFTYPLLTDMDKGSSSGFVRVGGEIMLAGAIPLFEDGEKSLSGRLIAVAPLPIGFKEAAEKVLETELFYTDVAETVSEQSRIAAGRDGFATVHDIDTLQLSIILNDLNNKAAFIVYGFIARQTGRAAIDMLIFHLIAFFFALIIFLFLANAVIYRMVQLPLEQFANAAEKLAMDGTLIGGGYRGIFAILAAKINLLGAKNRKIAKIPSVMPEQVEQVEPTAVIAPFDLNRVISKIMRKNTAFAEKNRILLYMDYPVAVPSLFLGIPDKTEEAVDLLASLLLQLPKEPFGVHPLIAAVERSADTLIIAFQLPVKITEQGINLIDKTMNSATKVLGGSLLYDESLIRLSFPLKAVEAAPSDYIKNVRALVVSQTPFRQILKRKLEAWGAEVFPFAYCTDIEPALLNDSGFDIAFIEAENMPALADFIKTLKAAANAPECILMKRGALPDELKELSPVVYSVNAANSEIKKLLFRHQKFS
ncbi:MAG: hypothetical protein LBP51_02425 [Deferribacteraceae bacterium]|jgi:hypothetical protein|nr:hypothetical protein [Deferribacteraceae bacterium]